MTVRFLECHGMAPGLARSKGETTKGTKVPNGDSCLSIFTSAQKYVSSLFVHRLECTFAREYHVSATGSMAATGYNRCNRRQIHLNPVETVGEIAAVEWLFTRATHSLT